MAVVGGSGINRTARSVALEEVLARLHATMGGSKWKRRFGLNVGEAECSGGTERLAEWSPKRNGDEPSFRRKRNANGVLIIRP